MCDLFRKKKATCKLYLVKTGVEGKKVKQEEITFNFCQKTEAQN